MAALFLFGALVFSAALLLASGVYLAWRGMRNRAPGRVAQRVRNASRGSADSHPALSISKQRLLARHPLVQRIVEAYERFDHKDDAPAKDVRRDA